MAKAGSEPVADGAAAANESTQSADEPLSRDQDAGTGESAGTSDEQWALTAEAGASSDRESLLPTEQRDRFSARWGEIQGSFVDQPRESVEQADALVADLMQRLTARFANERERLEGHWDRGDDVSTEDLRVALTRYRSFFDRLLSA
jgi:hypothetical protein